MSGQLRWLVTISIYGAAVHSARPGLQPLAVTETAALDRTCADFSGDCMNCGALPVKKYGCWCANSHPSKGCGILDRGGWGFFKVRFFHLATADPKTCRCLSSLQKSKEHSSVVRVAAINFCSALVEATAAPQVILDIQNRPPRTRPQDTVKQRFGVTPELCTEVLTGTLGGLKTSQHQNLFSDATALSKHEGIKGFGHLDPLITAIPSARKYQELLHHVCRDECEKMVNETLGNIRDMTFIDVHQNITPFETSCADRVVRHVESEILGCATHLQAGHATKDTDVGGLASRRAGSGSLEQTSKGCSSEKVQSLSHCPPKTKTQILKTCTRTEAGWQVSKKPDPDDEDEESCKMIGSDKALRVATPEECLSVKFENVGKIIRRFFEYKIEAKARGENMKDVVPEKPILCHVESDPGSLWRRHHGAQGLCGRPLLDGRKRVSWHAPLEKVKLEPHLLG
eukprot:s1145_g2.t1